MLWESVKASDQMKRNGLNHVIPCIHAGDSYRVAIEQRSPRRVPASSRLPRGFRAWFCLKFSWQGIFRLRTNISIPPDLPDSPRLTRRALPPGRIPTQMAPYIFALKDAEMYSINDPPKNPRKRLKSRFKRLLFFWIDCYTLFLKSSYSAFLRLDAPVSARF